MAEWRRVGAARRPRLPVVRGQRCEARAAVGACREATAGRMPREIGMEACRCTCKWQQRHGITPVCADAPARASLPRIPAAAINQPNAPTHAPSCISPPNPTQAITTPRCSSSSSRVPGAGSTWLLAAPPQAQQAQRQAQLWAAHVQGRLQRQELGGSPPLSRTTPSFWAATATAASSLRRTASCAAWCESGWQGRDMVWCELCEPPVQRLASGCAELRLYCMHQAGGD